MRNRNLKTRTSKWEQRSINEQIQYMNEKKAEFMFVEK